MRRISEKMKKRKARRMTAILDYFKNHGKCYEMDSGPVYVALCQACGKQISTAPVSQFEIADPAHKVRAWKDTINGDLADNLCIIHRKCHSKIDLDKELGYFMAQSPVNSVTGGIIGFPKHLRDRLD